MGECPRTVGVEEEMLLVDVHDGRPRAVSGRVVLRHALQYPTVAGVGVHGAVEGEFQQQMIETHTAPVTTLAALEQEVVRWRHEAIAAARVAGASVAALGTSPLPVRPIVVDSTRYAWMQDRYQVVARQHLTCGLHVHVAVESDEEGVAVLDRVRTWLPVVAALSANSPFSGGEDTGYASYRLQSLARWPSSGPLDVLGSAAAYHDLVRRMVLSSVLLDEGMVYFDARLSHHYPTVEIRVADVCGRAADTVLVAGLCRGLVETAAREWRAGVAAPEVPTALVRIASWLASREGLGGHLLDPCTFRPVPARLALDRLLGHLHDALADTGDLALVETGLSRLRERGTGADLQRRTLGRTGALLDVVAQAVRVTGGAEEG